MPLQIYGAQCTVESKNCMKSIKINKNNYVSDVQAMHQTPTIGK